MKHYFTLFWVLIVVAAFTQSAYAQAGTGQFFTLPDGGKGIVHQLSFLSQPQKATVDTLRSAANAFDTTSTAPIDVRGIARATLFVKNNWTNGLATIELPDTVFLFGQFSLDGSNYTAPLPLDTILVAIGPGTINGPQIGMMNGTKAPARTDTTSYRPLQLWPPMLIATKLDTVAATATTGRMAGTMPQRDIPANRLAFRGIHLPAYKNAKFYYRINNAAADTTAISTQAYLEWPGSAR